MSPKDERIDANVTVFIENVRDHVEEEHELFPRVRAALGRGRLGELGTLLESAKRAASHPDPPQSDVPPANAVAGVMGRDVSGTQDLVDGAIA